MVSGISKYVLLECTHFGHCGVWGPRAMRGILGWLALLLWKRLTLP